MNFPHMNDTNFPNINSVDVYKIKNTFDYARWQGKVTIKLMNVLWNSDYMDVPYFEDIYSRDVWFDSKNGYTKILESAFNITPENSIKVPIPFNDAFNYNYIMVDMPIQTSASQPLDYEEESIRIKRWFYFIEDMVQRSPNSTEIYIKMDYWTTFIHTVQIPYLMLERGHAPMMEIDVDTYLENPIENSEYLLADDFNYGSPDNSIIANTKYKPIGNGAKYIVFAAPYRLGAFALFDGKPLEGNSTAPTYSDYPARWGYQLQVDDYEWKYGETDYSNAELDITAFIEKEYKIPNGNQVYAIKANEAYDFFDYMAHKHVHFIHGIRAVFMLSEDMFNLGESFVFKPNADDNEHVYTIYNVTTKIQFDDINFSKEDFGFDEKYENITKLYTNPYSFIEVTDDNGNMFTFNIENCSSLQMRREVAIAFPFLRYDILFLGINGSGTQNYTWLRMNTETDSDNMTMWDSDFSKFSIKWDIPTYTIAVSSKVEYGVNNFGTIAARRQKALNDYYAALRIANTTRENTADSYATNTANVDRETAKNVANVNNTADTDLNNEENTQDGMMQQILKQNDYAALNFNAQNGEMGGTGDWFGSLRGLNADIATSSRRKLYLDVEQDNSLLVGTTIISNDQAVSNNWVNTASSIMGGITSGAQIGAMTAANPAVAATAAGSSVFDGVIGAISGSAATYVSINAKTLTTQKQKTFNENKRDNAITQLEKNFEAQKYYNNRQLQNEIGLRDDLAAIWNATAPTQGVNMENATAINTMLKTNIARDKTAKDTNAAATQSTETSNATYMRNAIVQNAKYELEQKQMQIAGEYKNSELRPPTFYGDYSGDAFPDLFRRRGIRFNIRTQTKAAIAQAGDAFLRFGYALHRNWDMTQGFHYGKHFTFWKAEDIWVNDGSGAANIATNTISAILQKGVTIWRNPDEIGLIGIYDNFGGE